MHYGGFCIAQEKVRGQTGDYGREELKGNFLKQVKAHLLACFRLVYPFIFRSLYT